MNAKTLLILQHMVQLNPSQLQSFFRKSSNTQIISVVCECLLNVVNGNVPVSITNLNNFEEKYRNLINPEMSLEKNSPVILSKQIFYLIIHILFFAASI